MHGTGPDGAQEGGLGISPHKDAGLLTLVSQNGVSGLEVLHQDTWHAVDPLPGAFVVNVGDMCQVSWFGPVMVVCSQGASIAADMCQLVWLCVCVGGEGNGMFSSALCCYYSCAEAHCVCLLQQDVA